MRLIDGDALKEKLQEQQKYGSTADSRGRAKAIVEVIHAPTVEAEPVKHGQWIRYHNHFPQRYQCSECGGTDVSIFAFCHHCGAKMDGDKT